MSSMHLTDGYKLDHRRQYPENTIVVYSNFTPRGTRVKNLDYVVFFGLQYFIKKYLIEEFNKNFFLVPKEQVIKIYQRRINNYLGPNSVGTEHISALHDLGYLPIRIKALPEGARVPLRVPMFTITNTRKDFFWLTNYFETLISCILWLPCTSATTADLYRKQMDEWMEKTNPEMKDFVQFQGHDFSFRGMPGLEAAQMSGAAHLLRFSGTDTIPAIDFLEEWYNADSDKELVGVSVPATEHSVMCMGTKEDEFETFKRLITEVYPTGIVSIVSDTWDLWKVLTDYLPRLKDEILKRDGKVVIRPDSGDPVDIICGEFHSDGTPKVNNNTPEAKGVIQLLWETFGGTVTSTGYKQLDSHIGAIYGDSITLERNLEINKRLAAKGFASTNLVFGIGSFTYQGAISPDAIVTRDTHGFAVKSTYGELSLPDGGFERRPIFKDPATDNGLKKSAKGLLCVAESIWNGKQHFQLVDNVPDWEHEGQGALQTVFENGFLKKETSLAEIRKMLN